MHAPKRPRISPRYIDYFVCLGFFLGGGGRGDEGIIKCFLERRYNHNAFLIVLLCLSRGHYNAFILFALCRLSEIIVTLK